MPAAKVDAFTILWTAYQRLSEEEDTQDQEAQEVGQITHE